MEQDHPEKKTSSSSNAKILLFLFIGFVVCACVGVGFLAVLSAPDILAAQEKADLRRAENSLKGIGIGVIIAKSDGKPCQSIDELIEKKYLKRDPHAANEMYQFFLLPSAKDRKQDYKSDTIMGFGKRREAGSSEYSELIILLRADGHTVFAHPSELNIGSEGIQIKGKK